MKKWSKKFPALYRIPAVHINEYYPYVEFFNFEDERNDSLLVTKSRACLIEENGETLKI